MNSRFVARPSLPEKLSEPDTRYFCPAEVENLLGNATLARRELGAHARFRQPRQRNGRIGRSRSPPRTGGKSGRQSAMKLSARIFVAGHRGMAGTAIVITLRQKAYENVVTVERQDPDLRRQQEVEDFLYHCQFDRVIHAAATVGGILAIQSRPEDFIYDNHAIETNAVHADYLNGVCSMLFLGSSCIYPRDCSQPIQESQLMAGSLESTNEPYALEKIT